MGKCPDCGTLLKPSKKTASVCPRCGWAPPKREQEGKPHPGGKR